MVKGGGGYHDDKQSATAGELVSLIGVGAQIYRMNEREGDTYVHYVKYEDHMFVSVTPLPIALDI